MTQLARLVVFILDGQRYALALGCVERVIRAVETTTLPGAPENVLGVVNVAGQVIPVLNIRRRLRLRERQILPSDHFLIARTGALTVALSIDEALGIVEHNPQEILAASQIGAASKCIQSVLKLGDGLVLIHDLAQFLSANEVRELTAALEPEASHAR